MDYSVWNLAIDLAVGAFFFALGFHVQRPLLCVGGFGRGGPHGSGLEDGSLFTIALFNQNTVLGFKAVRQTAIDVSANLFDARTGTHIGHLYWQQEGGSTVAKRNIAQGETARLILYHTSPNGASHIGLERVGTALTVSKNARLLKDGRWDFAIELSDHVLRKHRLPIALTLDAGRVEIEYSMTPIMRLRQVKIAWHTFRAAFRRNRGSIG